LAFANLGLTKEVDHVDEFIYGTSKAPLSDLELASCLIRAHAYVGNEQRWREIASTLSEEQCNDRFVLRAIKEVNGMEKAKRKKMDMEAFKDAIDKEDDVTEDEMASWDFDDDDDPEQLGEYDEQEEMSEQQHNQLQHRDDQSTVKPVSTVQLHD
jgi:hypothetical protein